MKKLFLCLLMLISQFNVFADPLGALPYQQCGGLLYTGVTSCVDGNYCNRINDHYSQCQPCLNGDCSVTPGTGGGGNNGNKFEKEVLTGQKLVVTSVTGQAAINAGIKIGQILALDTSAAIKAAISSTLKDCYKLVCYADGTCNCTSLDWTICVSGGCPPAGSSCQK